MATSEGLRAVARAQMEQNPDTFNVAEGKMEEVLDLLQDDIYMVGDAIVCFAGGNLVSATESLKIRPGCQHLFKRVAPPKRTIARTRDELRRQHDEANGVAATGLLTKHKHLNNRPKVK